MTTLNGVELDLGKILEYFLNLKASYRVINGKAVVVIYQCPHKWIKINCPTCFDKKERLILPKGAQ